MNQETNTATATAANEQKTIRAVFLYPPSSSYADNPDGWWSWPGNDFDAEGRQEKYLGVLDELGEKLGMNVAVDDHSIWTAAHADAMAKELEAQRPAGLLIVLFANQSRPTADRLSAAAQKLGVPVVYYIGLGVCHGPGTLWRGYRRAGVHFIMSLDNFDAIERGLRLIQEDKPLGQGPWP